MTLKETVEELREFIPILEKELRYARVYSSPSVTILKLERRLEALRIALRIVEGASTIVLKDDDV